MRINLLSYEMGIKPWILALAVIVVTILINLGNWQVSRADEKEAFLEAFEARNQQSLSIQELLDLNEPLQGYQTTITGQFNNKHSFLLDNQLYQGRAGYHVLTPFTTKDNLVLLVNRGWIFRGKYREELPEIPDIPGTVSFKGVIYLPSDKQIVLSDRADNLPKEWPKRLQKVDFNFMSKLLGVQLAPLTVRVNSGLELETGKQFIRQWITVSMPPEKHIGYALQWYGLALVFSIAFLSLGLKRKPKDSGTNTK